MKHARVPLTSPQGLPHTPYNHVLPAVPPCLWSGRTTKQGSHARHIGVTAVARDSARQGRPPPRGLAALPET